MPDPSSKTGTKPAAAKSPTPAAPKAPPPSPSPSPRLRPARPVAPVAVPGAGPAEIPIGVAIAASPGDGGTVTARKAGGLRDMAMVVDPRKVGVKAALQHLAKAVNIAFQTDFGENYLESVYQAAIVRRGEVHIIHKEYFGFGEGWFSQFGRLIRSLELTLDGPDPASPEGQKRIAEKGASTIRGLLNLVGRKLDLVAEYEDKVPAYVEQMFDRLEASGIILGWDRNDWEIWTTQVGLDIHIAPRDEVPPGAADQLEEAP